MEHGVVLKVLILEESNSEIQLIESVLRDSNLFFEAKYGRTEKEFIKHVNRYKPDIILTGVRFSKINLIEILEFLKKNEFNIPIVLLAGELSKLKIEKLLALGIDNFVSKLSLLTLPSIIQKSIELRKSLVEKRKTEELFQSQKARLDSFFENNPEAVIEVGFANEILKINSSASELFELQDLGQKSKKKKFVELVAASDLKAYKEAHSHACRGQKRNLLLHILLGKEKNILLDCKFVPITNQDKIITSILLIGTDVTEKLETKRELSISKSNYTNLISSIDEAVWSVDANFNIIDFNERASNLSKQLKGKKLAVGRSLRDFVLTPDRYAVWFDRYTKALKGEKIIIEDQYIVKDKKYFIHLTLYPLQVENKTIGITILARNISEQKKAEEELKNSERLFRTLSENAPVGIVKFDINGEMFYANNYLIELLETNFDELKGNGWLNFFTVTSDREKFVGQWKLLIERESVYQVSVKLSSKSGRTIWTKIRATLVKTDSETFAVGTVTDISLLKNVNDELQEKQLLLNAIESNSKIGFWVRDLENENFIDWSDANYKIFERDKNLGPMTLLEVINMTHPEDRENVIHAFNIVKNKGVMNVAFRVLCPAGKIKQLHSNGFASLNDTGEVIKISGTTTEISVTEMNDDFEFHNNTLKSVMAVARIGFWERHLKEKTNIWSTEMKKLMNLKESEPPLSLEVHSAMVHPEDREKFIHFHKHPDKNKPGSSIEYRILVNNNKCTHKSYASYYVNPQGEIEKSSGIVIDITKQLKTEKKLIESEKLFYSVLENSPDAIFIEDEDGNILDVNQHACDFQGMSKEILLGKNISDLIPESEHVKVKAEFKRLFNEESSIHKSKAWKGSGEIKNVEIKAVKIIYKNLPALLLNVRVLN